MIDVPEGWQLVPKTPTEGMLMHADAMTDLIVGGVGGDRQERLDEIKLAYELMLEKAPKYDKAS